MHFGRRTATEVAAPAYSPGRGFTLPGMSDGSSALLAPDHAPLQPLPSRGLAAVLLWACFVGSSWTWVIGMLLPVLLVADYGPWGWVAFAVPNVIGAGAVGFVLSSASARRVAERHVAACAWFSDATLAFHFFALAWVAQAVYGTAALWIALIAVGVFYAIKQPIDRRCLWAAAGVTAVSLIAFLAAQGLPGAWSTLPAPPPAEPAAAPVPLHQPPSLLMLAPGLALGFLLCPYLDLTLLRARRSTSPGTGRIAFALGFGVVFAAMILFSLCYAGVLGPRLLTARQDEYGDPIHLTLPMLWAILLGAHLLLQASLTVLLHTAELSVYAERDKWSRAGGWVLVNVPVLAYLLIATGWTPLGTDATMHGLTWGEWFYRAILVLYGTVFPAYVWLCVWPVWGRRLMPAGWVFAVAAPVAYALGYAGFVMGVSWANLAAVGVVAAARAAVGVPAMRPSVPSE